jgi:hypothetical protein
VTSSLIIGTGPAAAGVTLAPSRHRDEEITAIDIGTRGSAAKRSVIDRLASLPSSEWSAEEIASIRAESVGRARRSLPEKLSYGSDDPFRDVGELRGIRVLGTTNNSIIWGAYGGFTVWGTQVMPLSAVTPPVLALNLANSAAARDRG